MKKKNCILKKLNDISKIHQRAAFTGVEHGLALKKNPFLKLAESRYSCRGFEGRPVSRADIDAILEAARLAPTAVNKQPVHVWAITNPGTLEAIKGVTRSNYGAPLILVVGCRPADAWVRRYDNKNGAEVDATIVPT